MRIGQWGALIALVAGVGCRSGSQTTYVNIAHLIPGVAVVSVDNVRVSNLEEWVLFNPQVSKYHSLIAVDLFLEEELRTKASGNWLRSRYLEMDSHAITGGVRRKRLYEKQPDEYAQLFAALQSTLTKLKVSVDQRDIGPIGNRFLFQRRVVIFLTVPNEASTLTLSFGEKSVNVPLTLQHQGLVSKSAVIRPTSISAVVTSRIPSLSQVSVTGYPESTQHDFTPCDHTVMRAIQFAPVVSRP